MEIKDAMSWPPNFGIKVFFFFLIEEHLVEKLRAFFRMKNLLLLMVCDHVFVFVCGE